MAGAKAWSRTPTTAASRRPFGGTSGRSGTLRASRCWACSTAARASPTRASTAAMPRRRACSRTWMSSAALATRPEVAEQFDDAARVAGFSEVMIEPGQLGEDLVGALLVRGDRDQHHAAEARSQRAGRVIPVHLRHADIQDDDVGKECPRLAQS